MKTVCYVNERATGVAAMVPLACRDIVFKKGSRMGDMRQTVSGRNGTLRDLSEPPATVWPRRPPSGPEDVGIPRPSRSRWSTPRPKSLRPATPTPAPAGSCCGPRPMPTEPAIESPQTRKASGTTLSLSANEAASFGLGHVVNDSDELKDLYALASTMRVEGPGWVDWLVTVLTDPYVSWMLLFIGAVMLVVELKLPGIGLPAIISAVAFLLFFGSHYLSGTADQLEIILFLIGLVCIALEIFVFPGFGVFGMSGILLMLCSIVLASHTFVWPTQDYEYQELGHTLLQLTGMLVAVGGCTVVLARYFPSMPLFNRLILKPEPWTTVEYEDSQGRHSPDGYESLTFLIGETGRTTTPLRPTGKARFGSLLLDVTAVDRFVEPDTLIEVVDVQGSRVTVKKIGG